MNHANNENVSGSINKLPVSKDFELDQGYKLYPGEFALVMRAIKDWPAMITFTNVNCDALKFETEHLTFEVAFKESLDDSVREKLASCSWRARENLAVMASMIPPDTILLESQLIYLEMDMDKYERFIGGIRGHDTWRDKQDLWIHDSKYRELDARKDEISSKIPELSVFISSKKLEFYLGDGVHDICVTSAVSL